MLLAEIHGHALREVQDNEDYLTSELFGHLRYVPPSIFWNEFFSYAVRGTTEGSEHNLASYLKSCCGLCVTDYTSLRIHFWPRHSLYGVPDLALCFEGSGITSLVVLVEAKLGAEKSGTGDHDQLVRYLNILDDLPGLDLGIRAERGLGDQPYAFLLYLTPRDSLDEVAESGLLWDASRPGFERLYRVQWQDVTRASRMATSPANGPSALILADVAHFLATRGLEYFRGFGQTPLLQFMETEGTFYSGSSSFAGFSVDNALGLNKDSGHFYFT
jgi:hypothetical protein